MSDRLKIESVEGMFADAKQNAGTAHVIVCGNEKGGSGKTTTSMHVAIALLKKGFKVATIDLDFRQNSLTRYVENRKNCRVSNAGFFRISARHRRH